MRGPCTLTDAFSSLILVEFFDKLFQYLAIAAEVNKYRH
jgi:hypothetical protein